MLRSPSRRNLFAGLATIAVVVVVGLVANAGIVPMPAYVSDLVHGRTMAGEAVTAKPIDHPPIPEHPVMAPNGRSSMHNDGYASDTYAVTGPLGDDLQVTTKWYGASECATMAFDSRDRIVGLCGGIEGFRLRLIDPVSLRPMAGMVTSWRKPKLANPFTDICGGTYFYLDRDDVVWTLTIDKEIWAVAVTEDGFEKRRSYPLADHVPGDDCVVATMPDWDGRVFFATQQGRVGVLDPETGAVNTMHFEGEGIYNSLAVDEQGIYLVTTHRLALVAADDDGVPGEVWSTTYPRGSEKKPGMLSQGSGTTPTLIDDDLVVIGDNDEPRMNVRFYTRAGEDAGKEICSVPVFDAGTSTTENTLASVGRAVLVQNDYGYRGIHSTLFGRTTAPGIAKVALEDGECVVKWTNPVSAPSNVPKVSLGSGLLYTYTKDSSVFVDDSWYFTAIDVETGETAWRYRTGNGVQWNNHYASLYLGPDGAAYVPTMMGMIRISDG